MEAFKLNQTPLVQARSALKAAELSPPALSLVCQEMEELAASALKTQRQLLNVDSAEWLLSVHASTVERHLGELVAAGLCSEQVLQEAQCAQRVIQRTRDRLRRSEIYTHDCNTFYLAGVEERIRQLQDLQADSLPVYFE